MTIHEKINARISLAILNFSFNDCPEILNSAKLVYDFPCPDIRKQGKQHSRIGLKNRYYGSTPIQQCIICNNKATHYVVIKNEIYYYCDTHIKPLHNYKPKKLF